MSPGEADVGQPLRTDSSLTPPPVSHALKHLPISSGDGRPESMAVDGAKNEPPLFRPLSEPAKNEPPLFRTS